MQALSPWRDPRPPPDPTSRRRRGRPRIKRVNLRWLCLRPPQQLQPHECDALQDILNDDERLAAGYELLQRFRRLINRRSVRDLIQWLADAAESGLRPFASLAHGIQADYAAVVNGLKLPWSTGPVEGTVTRVKLLEAPRLRSRLHAPPPSPTHQRCLIRRTGATSAELQNGSASPELRKSPFSDEINTRAALRRHTGLVAQSPLGLPGLLPWQPLLGAGRLRWQTRLAAGLARHAPVDPGCSTHDRCRARAEPAPRHDGPHPGALRHLEAGHRSHEGGVGRAVPGALSASARVPGGSTRQHARTATFNYVEGFYNGLRCHSTLDYQSRDAFEAMYVAAILAA
jgi:hypothetical protein